MRGKKPTRKQKILLKSRGLIPDNWLVMSDDGKRMVVLHRHSLKQKTVAKEDSGWK